MAQRRILSVSARAFVSPRKGSSTGASWTEIANVLSKEGGNPVTIFFPLVHEEANTSPFTAITPLERSELAKSCSWESIIVEPPNHSDASHTYRFFMPSGEEVSFCGHAAIGASAFVANKNIFINSSDPLSEKLDLQSLSVPFLTADNLKYESKVSGNEVELIMGVGEYEETNCNQMPNAPALEAVLKELGLNMSDLSPLNQEFNWPTYVNSSVARPKTLIPIKSVERMHAATAPIDPEKFRNLCDSIDSSGIYLYSKSHDDGCFECRQFPRASGYAEDPATGIAAGALATNLYMKGMPRQVYTVYQGTAMGRPSKIQVKIGNHDESKLEISYSGLVVIDSITYVE
jgi:trans-2,3-dihydro-3-hydroxyanthranilate isomerase